ncbi:hypothetical protein CLV51_102964 [Chitinophaga niastensis]|uniref:Uncharacterized protein n=1 Tax=Chitinophaga niastensis TaxID=536980 RepID=A0A2P8HPH4_CHINA|nr:hypothetical protein [Chitinophaga niastensis]PSL48102.1 hypothetical protein CLV51_102964 [Chitinophaga niastensis]
MLKHLLYILLLGTAATPVLAQAKKKAAPAAATVSNKRPTKLRSSWGVFLSDTLPKSEIIKLLDSSLVVRDEKNVKYPIISFAFTYERHEPYLNDTTGQPAVYKDFTGENFKQGSLSALWSSRLKELLQTGDILYFDEIIIRYAGEKYYKAPALRIDVK